MYLNHIKNSKINYILYVFIWFLKCILRWEIIPISQCLVSWRHFGVHKDDFQDVTSESYGELMKADFQGVTSKSDIKLMLSHNQLKVGGSLQRRPLRQNRCRSSDLREKKGFSLEGKDNQQKTYDNETGERTSGQGPIFIQDWQAHLGNKEYGPDKQIGDVGACAQA